MRRTDPSQAALREWSSIPRRIRSAVSGLTPKQLDRRGGSEDWSIREYVHHLVEANLIASNIVIAALGRNGGAYDWSWVTPDAGWMRRLGYDAAPIEPALELHERLCAHVTSILRTAPASMNRVVKLLDAPGAKPRRTTVRQVLEEECEHAGHHLRDVKQTRKASR